MKLDNFGGRIGPALLTLLTLLASASAATAAPKPACPDTLAWADGTDISSEFKTSQLKIGLSKFSDALRVRVEDARSTRELILLAGVGGLTRAPHAVHPDEFMGLDMVAGIPLQYLQWRVPHPCKLDAETALDFDFPQNAVPGLPASHVSGVLRRSGASISYALKMRGQSQAEQQEYEGAWSYRGPAKPIDDATDIRDWQVYRQDEAAAAARFDTVGALRADARKSKR
ncbi:MAG: hypothetical protein H7Z39_07980 [Burkholderiaceae bacterium]|nr:hypothetical protein [Burkholderiaceae bacterium]